MRTSATGVKTTKTLMDRLNPVPISIMKVLSNLQAGNYIALQKYVEKLQLKAYSPNTISTYRNEFAQSLYVLKNKNFDDLDTDRLR